jgi:hypothetical protein
MRHTKEALPLFRICSLATFKSCSTIRRRCFRLAEAERCFVL